MTVLSTAGPRVSAGVVTGELMSALKRPEPRPGVLEIQAYVPGRSTTPHAARVFKLSSNETPLGPSPLAVRAIKRLVRDGMDMPLLAAIQSEQLALGLLRDSADRIEGRIAFQEKRKPNYQGR